MKIVYPISLDKQSNPIATLLREVALGVQDFECYALSGMETEEDSSEAERLWGSSHINAISVADCFLKRFDIVHHASVSKHNLKLVAAIKMRSLGRVRHVYTANLQMDDQDSALLRHGKAIKLSNDVIAVSEAVKRDVEKRFNKEVVKVIPNGYSEENYYPGLKSVSPRPTELPTVQQYFTYCGTLVQRKRPDLFLNIARAMPNEEFVIVGSRGWLIEEKFVKQAERLPNVRNLGVLPRSEAAKVIAHSTGLIFPSEREGLPLSVIEAMGLGIPVIVQNKSSLPELVRSESDGFVVGTDRVEDWVLICQELLKWSDEKRSNFGRQLGEETARRYSWNKIASLYQEYYDSLRS